MMNSVTMGVMASASAPELSLSVSPSLQTVLRGFAVVLFAVLVIVLLVKNIKFGRGGGGGGRVDAKTIIIVLLTCAMLMDVGLFVTALNWGLALVYEIGQWIGDFLANTSGGDGGGSVDIN
jgi:hypothetical protein